MSNFVEHLYLTFLTSFLVSSSCTVTNLPSPHAAKCGRVGWASMERIAPTVPLNLHTGFTKIPLIRRMEGNGNFETTRPLFADQIVLCHRRCSPPASIVPCSRWRVPE